MGGAGPVPVVREDGLTVRKTNGDRMTTVATTSQHSHDTQSLICVGKNNADKIRKARNEYFCIFLSAPVWGAILPYFVFGEKAALFIVGS